jgi:hypothetical protein
MGAALLLSASRRHCAAPNDGRRQKQCRCTNRCRKHSEVHRPSKSRWASNPQSLRTVDLSPLRLPAARQVCQFRHPGSVLRYSRPIPLFKYFSRTRAAARSSNSSVWNSVNGRRAFVERVPPALCCAVASALHRPEALEAMSSPLQNLERGGREDAPPPRPPGGRQTAPRKWPHSASRRPKYFPGSYLRINLLDNAK